MFTILPGFGVASSRFRPSNLGVFSSRTPHLRSTILSNVRCACRFFAVRRGGFSPRRSCTPQQRTDFCMRHLCRSRKESATNAAIRRHCRAIPPCGVQNLSLRDRTYTPYVTARKGRKRKAEEKTRCFGCHPQARLLFSLEGAPRSQKDTLKRQRQKRRLRVAPGVHRFAFHARRAGG